MLLAAAACGSASANDSTAELATGGLILTKSDRHRDAVGGSLYVSPREIRVSYRFYNASPADVTTLVAFPMPDITVADVGTRHHGSDQRPAKPAGLLDLGGRRSGQGAHPAEGARRGGIDRTADLERLKVPLAPHLPSTDKAHRQAAALGVGRAAAARTCRRAEEYSAGRSMRKGRPSPRWTLQTTYYWEQTFPAGAEVTVEHGYKPSIGQSAQTMLGDPEAMKEPWFKAYAAQILHRRGVHCGGRARPQGGGHEIRAPFSEQRISYRLSTGANWARPIGRFRLVVDKGDPASLVSFCGHGRKADRPDPVRGAQGRLLARTRTSTSSS